MNRVSTVATSTLSFEWEDSFMGPWDTSAATPKLGVPSTGHGLALPPQVGCTHQGSFTNWDTISRRDGLTTNAPASLAKPSRTSRLWWWTISEGWQPPEGRMGAGLTLEEASKLTEKELGRRTKWFFFLPETWRRDRIRKWETRQAERAARGETPYAWRVTEEPVESEQARAALRAEARGERVDGQGTRPLRHRLRGTRMDRGLSLVQVGKLFGVSHSAVSQWETGPDPDEDGKIRGRPIPRRLVPLVERWVATGEVPIETEMAASSRPRHARAEPSNAL